MRSLNRNMSSYFLAWDWSLWYSYFMCYWSLSCYWYFSSQWMLCGFLRWLCCIFNWWPSEFCSKYCLLICSHILILISGYWFRSCLDCMSLASFLGMWRECWYFDSICCISCNFSSMLMILCSLSDLRSLSLHCSYICCDWSFSCYNGHWSLCHFWYWCLGYCHNYILLSSIRSWCQWY